MVSQGLAMTNILILGGTTEASLLAVALRRAGLPATLSYAGRVANPAQQPIPVRTGGFGGVEGLADYLTREKITHLIDATHPFAAEISRHAVEAAAATATALIALERLAWTTESGDRWTHVPDIPAAAAALSGPPRRVFLAIGRQHLADFAGQPQHHYLLRLIDPPHCPLPVPHQTTVIARGPFTESDDLDLLRLHRIDTIVAKNAGGTGAAAKLLAARKLGLPVIMVARPLLPERLVSDSVAGVMDWLHATPRGV